MPKRNQSKGDGKDTLQVDKETYKVERKTCEVEKKICEVEKKTCEEMWGPKKDMWGWKKRKNEVEIKTEPLRLKKRHLRLKKRYEVEKKTREVEKKPGPKKNWPYFPWNTGWLIGILVLIIVCYNPHKNWVVFHPLYTLNNQVFVYCSYVGFRGSSRHGLLLKWDSDSPGTPKDMGPPKLVSGTHTIRFPYLIWDSYLVGGFNPFEKY